MNGCHYRFNITGMVTEEVEYTGTMDIVGCEVGKKIEIEVTTAKKPISAPTRWGNS
jgi:hypothetical protein